MVAVLDVLKVELPVVRQDLGIAAVDTQWLVQHAQQARRDGFTEIVEDRRRFVGQGAKHQATERGDAQFARTILAYVEVGRHAALAIDALRKRRTEHIAFEVVTPRVVGADEILGASFVLEREQRSAVCATVLKGVDAAIRPAIDDHRHLADKVRQVVSRLGNFCLKAQVVPDRSKKQLFLLPVIHLLILIQPVGDACDVTLRPFLFSVYHASPFDYSGDLRWGRRTARTP